MWCRVLVCSALLTLGASSDSASVTSLLQLEVNVSVGIPTKGELPLPSVDQPAKVVSPAAQIRPAMPVRPLPTHGGPVLPESWVWDQLQSLPSQPQPLQPPKPLARFAKSGRQEKYEFMHIPKNAGTAVESAGQASGIRWGAKSKDFWGDKHEMPDGNSCSRWHVPCPRLTSPNPYKSADSVFCVTRHPYNKFVSEYTWRLRNGYLADTGGYSECSEEALNYFLQTSIGEVQDGRRWTLDCHFTPQVDFIWDDESGEAWCTNVLRYDDLPNALDNLMSTWGLPVTLSSATHINKSGPYCPDLDTRNLTNETRTMIASVYAKDFERLQYDPDTVY